MTGIEEIFFTCNHMTRTKTYLFTWLINIYTLHGFTIERAVESFGYAILTVSLAVNLYPLFKILSEILSCLLLLAC